MTNDRDAMLSMYQHASDVQKNGLPGESVDDWQKKDHRSLKDEPDDPVELTEEQLVRDSNFQQLAGTVYDYFNPSERQVWTDLQIETALSQGADPAFVKRLAFRSTRTEEEKKERNRYSEKARRALGESF